MPWSRTTDFPHPFAVPAVKMGAVYNYTSYIAVDQGLWIPLSKKFNNWRKVKITL
jgi:sterol 3beta-glucosyltransferase